FEAFRDSQVTVILAVGEQNDINQLENIPSNFKLYNYVPQLDILQHTDLFITHGGMNSSSESLYFGVPMLVIPVMGDQPIVAQRIEELEAGVQLNRNLLTPEILRNTTMDV
ncbi:nucleotide disphospho-sugar-binding domain-containing protein, partial [Bacillus thuringiensis]